MAIPKSARDFALKHRINLRYAQTPDGGAIYSVIENGRETEFTRSKYPTAANAVAMMRRYLRRRGPEKNPAKFDRCVRDVKRSLKRYKRPGNPYAICQAAGVMRRPRRKNPVRVRDPEHKALVTGLRKHFSHDEAMLKRARRKNPPGRFILKLERGPGQLMLYYNGQHFDRHRSNSHEFSSKRVAVTFGKHLLRKFPILYGTVNHPYQLYVTRK